MPLFGLRTSKKNEQSQIETSAGEAKAVTKKSKKPTRALATVTDEKNTVQPSRGIAMPKGTFSGDTDAIIRPHITEKSGIQSQNGVYTFEVAINANKQQVAKAVKTLYKVTAVKIGMINIPTKKVFIRGKKGTVPGMKKAIITVKKGEKIDFV